MSTMKLRYSSSRNITFRGEWDTGIEREEWETMSESERNEIIEQAYFDLADVWEAEES